MGQKKNKRICSVCKKEKTLENFYKRTNGYYHSPCKKCYNLDKKEKYSKKSFEEKHNRSRKNVLSRCYGLTIEDYNKMFESQNGLCAICGLPETQKNRKTKNSLAVDHNHNTNKIRGLLCSKCNTAIGSLRVDNLGTLNLEMAIRYLKNVK